MQIVRRGLDRLRESYETGAATDGLLDLCAPGIQVDATRRVFNPAVYEGDAGVRRAIQEIGDAGRTSTKATSGSSTRETASS